MAKDKKTKTPPVEAPVVDQPKKEDEVAATVIDMNTTKGLSQHDKLQFATELRHRVSELKEEDNPPLALIAGYNMIRDVTFIDLAAGEIACGASATGYIFSGNEIAYKALQAAAVSLGVTLPEFKTLPAPSKSDLEKVGLTGVGNVKLLNSSAIKVSDEAKKKKKAEQKVIDAANSGKKEYLKDHTKIETDDQLKEALEFQLVNPAITNPIEKLITTTQFYRAYLEARAEKADDPQAELTKIHEFTLADLLQDITQLVKPTFITAGFGKRLGTLAEDANCVVPAFCSFKDCVYNKKTGKYQYTDEEIAAFVRVLIVWYASSKSAEMSEAIKAKEENLKVLKKDEKANEKGIETENKKIAGLKSAIAHFNSMISLTSDPSFDLADDFIAAFNGKDHKDHIPACSVEKAILNTYYRGIDIPELEFDSMLLNVQQRIGIILNLFSSEVAKRDDYDESNLIEISSEAPAKEEPKEEESKNS